MIGKELIGKEEFCLCLSEPPGSDNTLHYPTLLTEVFICGKILQQLMDLLLHAFLYR